MNIEKNHQMDAHNALERARRIENTVRRRARWHGWVWLTVGLITPVFLIGANADWVPRDVQFSIALGFMVVGAVLAVWETRVGLWGREAARADRPYTWAYVATMVTVAAVTIIANPTGPSGWFVALALLPSIPCLIAAWRILGK